MHFKFAVFTVFLLIVFCSALSAQDDSTKVSINSLEKGAKSLQFRVTDNFTLSSFDGSDISIKRQTSSKTAQRLGVGILIDLDSNRGDSDNSNISGLRDSEGSDYDYRLDLNALWLRYLTPAKRMSFYWGVGPIAGISIGNSDSKSTITFSDTTAEISENEQDRMTLEVGGLLVFGTEFFVHKQISLTAEYRSTSSFFRSTLDRKQKETDINGTISTVETGSSSNRLRIGVSAVYLGLSAYF